MAAGRSGLRCDRELGRGRVGGGGGGGGGGYLVVEIIAGFSM